jgi:stage II sporulation protein M
MMIGGIGMKHFGTGLGKKEPITHAIILFLLSLILGCVFAKLTQNLLSVGIDGLSSRYFNTIKNMDIQYKDLFQYIVVSLLRSFFMIWIMSLTILGLPYIIWLIVSKAFQFGYLTTALAIAYGGKGVVLSITYLFPQGIIYLPVAFLSIKYCYQLTMEMNHGQATPSLHNIVMIKKYFKMISILLAALLVGAIFETFIGSYLVRKVLGLF